MNPGLRTVMLFSSVLEILPHTNRPVEERKEAEYGAVQPACIMVRKVDFRTIQPWPKPAKGNGIVTTDSNRKTFGSVLSDFENAALTF